MEEKKPLIAGITEEQAEKLVVKFGEIRKKCLSELIQNSPKSKKRE